MTTPQPTREIVEHESYDVGVITWEQFGTNILHWGLGITTSHPDFLHVIHVTGDMVRGYELELRRRWNQKTTLHTTTWTRLAEIDSHYVYDITTDLAMTYPLVSTNPAVPVETDVFEIVATTIDPPPIPATNLRTREDFAT